MAYDYFYGRQPEQYQFFKLPKILIKEERFQDVSVDAKVLYSMMLDRAALSAENGWLDETGRVFIYFTIDEICKVMACANQKATKLLRELEREDLIRRKRSGFNMPDRIYVMNFVTEMWKSHVRNHENHDTGDVKIMIPESWKSHPNKTEKNKTEESKTYPIISAISGPDSMADPIREDAIPNPEPDHNRDRPDREEYRRYFHDQLDVPGLLKSHPYDDGRILGIVELLSDVCSGEDDVLIGKTIRPVSVVRSRLMKLEYKHICYVLHSLDETRSDVRNIRQYLLAVLYNAAATMEHYYHAKVNHDMAAGVFLKEGENESEERNGDRDRQPEGRDREDMYG